MSDQHEDLIGITELFHLRAMNLLRQRRAAVSQTKARLDEIQALREAAQADTEAVDARRMSGSDSMWQGWLAVRTSQLQQEMAINKALELDGLASSRNAFARLDAAEQMAKTAKLQAKTEANKREIATLEWLGIMWNWVGK